MKVGAIRAAVVTAVVLVVSSARAAAPAAPSRGPATPPELVATYDALADAILGANKAERKLVIAILGATYGHAQSELARAGQALKANDAGAARAAGPGPRRRQRRPATSVSWTSPRASASRACWRPAGPERITCWIRRGRGRRSSTTTRTVASTSTS